MVGMSKTADAGPGRRRLTRDDIAAALLALGIRPGDHLALGIDASRIGRLEHGADTVIEGVMQAVTADGTMMLNAYTSGRPLRVLRRRLEDPSAVYTRASVPNTGAVAKRLVGWPGAVRSMHPTNSVVALGSAARLLTAMHDAHAGAYSPYSTLGAIDGRFVAIGIGDRLVGLRHEAQARAGMLSLVPRPIGALYRDESGSLQLFRRPDPGGCVTRLPDLVGEMRTEGLVTDGRIGLAEARLVDVASALRSMTRRLVEQPERYLCADETCLWCRTVERRLKLLGRVERPARFQRSRLLRTAITIENGARLRGRQPGRLARLAARALRRADGFGSRWRGPGGRPQGKAYR